MPRPRNLTPSYLPHASGQGRLVWTDTLGVRHYRMLPGPFGSPESLAAKARLELEIATAPTRALSETAAPIAVNEVLLAHRDYADRHYRRADGSRTHEVVEYRTVCRVVRELYGLTPAAEFGPLALKAVRQAMIARGWCRTLVNQRIGRARRVFKWAAGEQLIPFGVYQALTAVTGLQRGRTEAPESEPVGPVDEAVVDATLSHLNRHVRGLVEFQRLTGCRPGEACTVRRRDIDTGGSVWLYRPPHHKLAYKNKPRTIAVGPKAQALLREFFTPDLDDYLFSPRRAVDEFHAGRSADRRTPRFPSHMARNEGKRAKKPRRAPAAVYDVTGYGHAVKRACDRAFPPPGDLARRANETQAAWRARLTDRQREEVKVWRTLHHWHPNQLRHTFATKVRKAHGLEAAQVLLGHARADVTQVYAEKNEALAVTVAAQMG